MIKIVMILLFLAGHAKIIVGQTFFIKKSPVVKVILSSESNEPVEFDKIKLIVKVENVCEDVQEILFDKPNRIFPWGTFVTIVNEIGDTVSSGINKEMLSSTLYTQEQLKMQKAFYYLQPHAWIQGNFGLSDMVILKSFAHSLATGKYRVSMRYYGNRSNSIVLNILQENSR